MFSLVLIRFAEGIDSCRRRNDSAVHRIEIAMLELDNSTLANMTAALDHGCKMLSGKHDTARNRKRIGNAIVAAAKSYKRSLSQLMEVAESEVSTIRAPRERPPFKRFRLNWW